MWNPARCAHLSIAVLLLAMLPSAASAQNGWSFGAITTASYRLDAVSSSQIFAGPLGAADPTLNLTLGERYQVTVAAGHPLTILGKGSTSASDVTLLIQGAAVGTLEADPGIQWLDAAGKVTFTVTQTLIDAMNAPGRAPGYRCNAHPTTMRGDFAIVIPPAIPSLGALAWLALVALLGVVAWLVQPRAQRA